MSLRTTKKRSKYLNKRKKTTKRAKKRRSIRKRRTIRAGTKTLSSLSKKLGKKSVEEYRRANEPNAKEMAFDIVTQTPGFITTGHPENGRAIKNIILGKPISKSAYVHDQSRFNWMNKSRKLPKQSIDTRSLFNNSKYQKDIERAQLEEEEDDDNEDDEDDEDDEDKGEQQVEDEN